MRMRGTVMVRQKVIPTPRKSALPKVRRMPSLPKAASRTIVSRTSCGWKYNELNASHGCKNALFFKAKSTRIPKCHLLCHLFERSKEGGKQNSAVPSTRPGELRFASFRGERLRKWQNALYNRKNKRKKSCKPNFRLFFPQKLRATLHHSTYISG